MYQIYQGKTQVLNHLRRTLNPPQRHQRPINSESKMSTKAQDTRRQRKHRRRKRLRDHNNMIPGYESKDDNKDEGSSHPRHHNERVLEHQGDRNNVNPLEILQEHSMMMTKKIHIMNPVTLMMMLQWMDETCDETEGDSGNSNNLLSRPPPDEPDGNNEHSEPMDGSMTLFFPHSKMPFPTNG
ncbi:MAG: hypothetical protein SGARI_007556 [Bacillariaceae sp.]